MTDNPFARLEEFRGLAGSLFPKTEQRTQELTAEEAEERDFARRLISPQGEVAP